MIPDAFLQAILAEPASDGPRLVLCDWLEERGGEAERARAAFVRAQVELASDPSRERACREACLPPDFEGCPQKALRRRELELLPQALGLPAAVVGDDHALDDMGSPERLYRARDGSRVIRAVFRRGFVAALTLSAAAWLEHADALLAAAPVDDVTISDGWEPLEDALHVEAGPAPEDSLWRWRRRETRHRAGDNHGLGGRDFVLFMLAAEWPRIRFTLSEAAP